MKKLHLITIALATLNLQLLTHNAQAQVGFEPAIYYPAGNYPFSITCADFNGDTKRDLAISRDSSILILIGNGSGNFMVTDSFAVGWGPKSIISADFNGDGKADLATANYTNHSVSVLLGNGLGSFGPAANFTIGGFPESIVSADFNGDGKPDLAIAKSGSNNISVLLGNGSGGFGAATNFPVVNTPTSIITADFNGDGKADLAVTDSTLVSIYLGNGLGSFATATNFTLAGIPQSVTTGDFNGDGKVDLATANNNSFSVSVLIGNGTGGFGTITNITTTTNPYSIVSADFNGDGKADLAMTNESSNLSVSVLLGDGLGHFGGLAQISAGVIAGGSDIISSDFNGDGKADLALTNHFYMSAAVLINNPLAAFPLSPPICIVTVDSTHTHNIVVWEKTSLNMIANDSFLVYREITTNNYQRIGAVLYDSISTFNDYGANPAATAYRYKLKSKNAHGVVAQNFSPFHNTMYLTNNGANFSWTPYSIENTSIPVSAYYIYRDNNTTGNFQTIGNTTGNQLGFTDVNYSSYPNASYYVEAVRTTGACHPTRLSFNGSMSNVTHIGSNGVQQLNNPSTINIYPNPAGNMLYVSGIAGKTILRLYDIVGELVMEKEVENNTTINTSQLAKGIYTLLFESKTSRMFTKVAISH